MNFGIDIDTPGGTELNPYFAEVADLDGLAQALARRIVTPRGTLDDDPEYGHDVRAYLNDDTPPLGVIGAAVADQWRRDERVARATATATLSGDGPSRALVIAGDVVSSLGPFRLVLTVDTLTLADLRVET